MSPLSRLAAVAALAVVALGACGHVRPVRGRRSGIEELRRDLYLSQRAIGGYQALQRGRLPQRLIRRRVARSLMRALFR